MFAIAAVIMCVPLSFAAGGPLGGGAHVIAVASAWTYNLYFKTTRLSWLPYAVSFGLIPAFVTYGLTPPHAPAVWLTAAAALMGVGAHLANALPDLESDDAIGVGGVASSLGRHNTAVVAVSLLFMAIALLIANVHVGVALSSAVIILALAAIAAALRSSSDALLFRVIMGLALVAVALLLVSSTSLSR
jgi:4-hydroxybenzoate polyprenyltransferase